MNSEWTYPIVLAIIIGVALYVMRRFSGQPDTSSQAQQQLEEKLERLSRDMRFEVTESLRGNRQEMSQAWRSFSKR
jgi:type II secretory pathway pseudopilin PulG